MGNFTEFHAHKYYLALVSNVLRKRFFGILRDSSDVLDVRGTTALAFEAMIKCVYHQKLEKRVTVTELLEQANLAEMYDVKALMRLVKRTVDKITISIKMKNVVIAAYVAERMSMFSFYSKYREAEVFDRCCVFLEKTLKTRVLDFSKLPFASKYPDTVKMLHEKILEVPLTACLSCPGFVHDYCHNDHYSSFEDECGSDCRSDCSFCGNSYDDFSISYSDFPKCGKVQVSSFELEK